MILGEAADPILVKTVEDLVAAEPNVEKVVRVLSVQQGPGEILVAMKIKFRNGLTTEKLVDAINAFERKLEQQVPDVKWSFIEPDRVD